MKVAQKHLLKSSLSWYRLFVFVAAIQPWIHLSEQWGRFKHSDAHGKWCFPVFEIPSRKRRPGISGMSDTQGCCDFSGDLLFRWAVCGCLWTMTQRAERKVAYLLLFNFSFVGIGGVSVQNRLLKTLLTLETPGNDALLGTKWSLKRHSQRSEVAWEKCYANEGSLGNVRLLHSANEGWVKWHRLCFTIELNTGLFVRVFLCVCCLCFDTYRFADWCWFLQGQGVKRNYTQGFQLLKKAAAMVSEKQSMAVFTP